VWATKIVPRDEQGKHQRVIRHDTADPLVVRLPETARPAVTSKRTTVSRSGRRTVDSFRRLNLFFWGFFGHGRLVAALAVFLRNYAQKGIEQLVDLVGRKVPLED
jgi:hypothetical protein